MKCQLDATDSSLLQNILFAQHVSGHHYAHHQEFKSIIQVVAALWYLVFWFSDCWSGVELWVTCPVCGLLQHPSNRTHNLYNTLELLMMGIMVHETCWTNNKFCNKEPSVASSWHLISTRLSKLGLLSNIFNIKLFYGTRQSRLSLHRVWDIWSSGMFRSLCW